MRAIRMNVSGGGPDDAVEEEVAAPEPSDHGLIIDVRSAGVSFPDLLLSKGEYQIKPEPPFTLGSEGAGRVAHAPDGSGFEVGERVAFLSLGAYAEQVVTAPLMTFKLPDELDYNEGAALIINYHTVLFALRDRGQLKSGENVLIQGAAGGVGTAAIQVAKAMGARVIAGVSTDEKAEVALEAGADDVVFTGGDEWLARTKEMTEGRGVDVVLDPVGGDHFTDNLRSLAEGGRLLVVGFAGGSIPEVKVNRLLLRNTSVVGVAWGAFVGTRPELAHEIGETVNAMAARGEIKPLIGKIFNFEDAADALKLLDERKATGKVVLQISED
jgi:NADPH2:quinone reductase